MGGDERVQLGRLTVGVLLKVRELFWREFALRFVLQKLDELFSGVFSLSARPSLDSREYSDIRRRKSEFHSPGASERG